MSLRPKDPAAAAARFRTRQQDAARRYAEKRRENALARNAFTSLQRSGPIARASAPKRSAIKPKSRKASETVRIYGPPARREWAVMLDCVTCGREATDEYPNQQSHIKSGGTGRKADASAIVTQCPSCHADLHRCGSAAAYERETGMEEGTMERLAAAQDAAWHHLTSTGA